MALSARDLIIELAVVLAITLVVAFLGPFGSFALGSFEERFLYWGLMIFGGYAIVRPFMLLASSLTARLRLPEAAVWLGLVAIAALPVTVLAWFGTGANRPPSPTDFLRLYPNVLLLGWLVTLVFWVLNRGPTAAESDAPSEAAQPSTSTTRAPLPPTASAPATGPRLLERLPPEQRHTVVALETEDHYVRVHSETRSSLILIRMRDAVAEMDGVDGMQVHRGWWVARQAVTGHLSDGRNLRLQLAGGLIVPVARGSVQAVQDAGLLGDRQS